MGEAEWERLLGKLDLRQKVRLLSGATVWHTPDEPAVGLRALAMSDGPVGVRGDSWDDRRVSLVLPSPSAMAATWDEDLVERLGGVLAEEARAKGVDVLLAPTLNLHRTPLGGRHFECYSEDPLLVGRTGAALVRGVQSQGVAATAKHFAANESETDRLTVDVRVDERTLRELYLAPFEDAVEAGVALLMTGYHTLNGTTMTEHPLLAEVVKGDWGFEGVVVSDWGAVRTTVAAALAAQDLAMPGPDTPWGEELVRAVESALVTPEAIDEKVRRLLRLAARLGALDGLDFVPDLTGAAPGVREPAVTAAGTTGVPLAAGLPPAPAGTAAAAPGNGEVRNGGTPRQGAAPGGVATAGVLLRRAVAAGSVLLANDGTLPLRPATLDSLAVIGTHARDVRVQGGGSAEVFTLPVISPLEALQRALAPTTRVGYAPGPATGALPAPVDGRLARDPRGGAPGVLLRMLDEAGEELYAEHRPTGRQLEPRLVPGADTVEISAVLRPGTPGRWTFGVAGYGRLSLQVDGHLVMDEIQPRETDDPAVVHVRPPQRCATVTLPAGRDVLVVARRRLVPDAGRATVLTAAPPAPPDDRALADAVAAAAAADAAVVFVGTTEESESEGRDRTTLRLPGRQDELVRAVAAVQPRTVAVLNCGGPVELPWREEVAAVLLAWFPGQEAGPGITDVLLGAAEPGGRLPTTWGALADAPVTATTGPAGTLPYTEGLHVGYRAWLRARAEPAYWFGHGLGYTEWDHRTARVVRRAGEGAGHEVHVELRNTGTRRGRELVQVYLSRADGQVERPVRWLAGYAHVEAEPDATVTAVVPLPLRALRHWSTAERGWRVAAGRYRVLVGRSAGDLPLCTELVVDEEIALPSNGRGR
ncbi:glycoside hydrolase family 3 C-terminal domain-containing protein [Streptomyces sp. NPDC059740]|uniref:glycoside hydrolase family 3 C-terminal domain-containing protein n=1 Tax=Streptomyces sp. NPDC059740 TaxID=3346926 RepID=UPI0036631258